MTNPEYREPVLPTSTRELLKKDDDVPYKERHPGLQLDKLSAVGDGTMEAQKRALERVRKADGDAAWLKALLARRNDTLNAIGARRLVMTTRGSLTLHLSRSGALENAGIALHPVYGFVYMPGSGIKGLVRAWAETVWAPAQTDKARAWRQIEEAFGWSPNSENHKFSQPGRSRPGWRPDELAAPDGASAGRLVFHEAWPQSWPQLILDVVNNHHVKYYTGKDDPGDWDDPNLAYFLAVGKDVRFEFAISDRRRDDNELLDIAHGWLRDALSVEGAGAKTAAGYGRFALIESEDEATPPKDERIPLKGLAAAGIESETFNLTLVTPAFLAGALQQKDDCELRLSHAASPSAFRTRSGALQQKDDCELRPATLRGLLRWWWRTMHAAHVDLETLRLLESAVWGAVRDDVQFGSPVRVAVDHVFGDGPVLYSKQDPQFQSLPRPEGKKVTQGLFYASYGMDDGPKNDPKKKSRWYRPAGCVWRVTLVARHGQYENVSLPADQILQQVAAALWLLTSFGGVGSRSRKGFGSFEDIETYGIRSIEGCKKVAAEFRRLCKLNGQPEKASEAPALDGALVLPDRDTGLRDPWHALDRVGTVLQEFAKSLKSDNRLALGLPRQVGRERLCAKKGYRHASPVFWSLTKKSDATLAVRLIAFPAAHLPDKGTSKKIFEKLIDLAAEKIRPSKGKRPSGRGPSAGISGTAPSGPSSSPDYPKRGDRVDAVLLKKKTNKGGWRAKHLDTGLEGPIHDTANAPAGAKEDQRVTLFVHSVRDKEMQFTWAEPTPAKKNRGTGRKPGRGPR